MKSAPNIAGVITPELLDLLSSSPQALACTELLLCNTLEIRYDLFADKASWPLLAARVLKYHPKAVIVGTIRLARDGGKVSNADFAQRFADWESICTQAIHPHWIDLEQFHLKDFSREFALAQKQGIRMLVSQHNFQHVPSLKYLRAQAAQARAAGAHGFKIAAMSKKAGDASRLYTLARKERFHFEWLATFAMGATGQTTRVRSLHYGANLTYVALGKAVAPGQLTAIELLSKLLH